MTHTSAAPTRLVDLDPKWIVLYEDGAHVGITFRCPHCAVGERGATTFLGVMFRTVIELPSVVKEEDWPNYILQHPNGKFWERTGDTFDTLTLSPSIDASQYGHWHGFITNGEIR